MTCPNNIIKGERENREKERGGGKEKEKKERERETAQWDCGCLLGNTHIGFTENDVYYAAKNDEGVKRVPGITKIALNRAGRVQMFVITYEMSEYLHSSV